MKHIVRGFSTLIIIALAMLFAFVWPLKTARAQEPNSSAVNETVAASKATRDAEVKVVVPTYFGIGITVSPETIAAPGTVHVTVSIDYDDDIVSVTASLSSTWIAWYSATLTKNASGLWEGDIAIPSYAKAGEYSVEVIASDIDGNKYTEKDYYCLSVTNSTPDNTEPTAGAYTITPSISELDTIYAPATFFFSGEFFDESGIFSAEFFIGDYSTELAYNAGNGRWEGSLYLPPEACGYHDYTTSRVYYTDNAGNYGNRGFGSIDIVRSKPGSLLTINSVDASYEKLEVGVPITWTANATGGIGEYHYWFTIYRNGRFYAYYVDTGTRNSFTFTPIINGEYKVNAIVRDANFYAYYYGSTTFQVKNGPLNLVSVTADVTSPIHTHTDIEWTANTTGGNGDILYRFDLYKNGSLLSKGTYGYSSSYWYEPLLPGTYQVRVYVKDDDTTTPLTQVSEGIVAVAELNIDFSVDKVGYTYVGVPLIWTATVTGGMGDKEYHFIVYHNDTAILDSGYQALNYVTYTPREPGAYYAHVYVQDDISEEYRSGAYVVAINPLAMEVTSNAANDKSTVKKPITWTVNATGGAGPYQYRYYVYKGTTLVTNTAYVKTNTYTYTPTSPGSYRVRAYVKDPSETINAYSSYITCVNALQFTSLTASKTGYANTGETITWTANTLYGGTKEYKFDLYVDGTLVQEGEYTSENTFSYMAEEPCTVYVIATVRDDVSPAVPPKTSAQIQVVRPFMMAIMPSLSVCAVKTPITWTVNATGGAGTYQYRYYVYKGTTLQKSTSYIVSNAYTFTPTSAGSYRVRAYVKDPSGTINTYSSYVTCVNALQFSSLTASKTGYANTGETITWTANTRYGGTKEYRFDLYVDGVLTREGEYDAENTFSYKAEEPCTVYVIATVRDDVSPAVPPKTSAQIQVVRPFMMAIMPNLSVCAVKTPITWTVNATGGVGTYQYCYYVYKGSTLQKSTKYIASNSYTFTPTSAGSYRVRAYVKDPSGTINTYSSYVTCVNALQFTSLTVSKTGYANTGETITWTANTLYGGTKEYRFDLYIDGALSREGEYSAEKTYAYTAEAPCFVYVAAFVRDDVSATVPPKNSAQIQVVRPLSMEITPSVVACRLNQPITWTVNATGGVGSYRYRYDVYKGSTLKKSITYIVANTCTYTPTSTGIYRVLVYVQDPSGTIKAYSSDLACVSPLQFTSLTASNTGYATTGEMITWTANTLYGGTKEYKFDLYVDGVLTQEGEYSAEKTFSYAAEEPCTVYVVATVIDDTGIVALSKQSAVITILAPLSLEVESDIERISSHREIAWTAYAAGGRGEYQFKFDLYLGTTLLTSTEYGTNETFTYTPENEGEYRVCVHLKDAMSVVEGYSDFVVVEDLPELNSVTANCGESATVNDTIVWTVDATGGSEIQYRFVLYVDGVAVVTEDTFGSGNTFSYTPLTACTTYVHVYAIHHPGSTTVIDMPSAVVTVSSAE